MATEKLLPIAGIEKLIHGCTDLRATAGAKQELKDVLEEYATRVAREAIVFSTHAGRNTVMASDVELVR